MYIYIPTRTYLFSYLAMRVSLHSGPEIASPKKHTKQNKLKATMSRTTGKPEKKGTTADVDPIG